MKKIISFIFLMTLSLGILCSCDNKQEENNVPYTLSFKYLEQTDSYSVGIDVECETIEVNIPSSYNEKPVTSIYSEGFSLCKSLKTIMIPESITSIETDAFNGCEKLEKVEINNLDAWLKIDFSNAYSNPLSYAKYLYQNGEKVKELIIPEGTEKIKNYAFYNFDELQRVQLPSSLLDIGSYAFYNCYDLRIVNGASELYSIGDYAFAKCTSLVNFIIPDTVYYIGESAFYCEYANEGTIIFCETQTQPQSWNTKWQKTSKPIYWGINEENFTIIDDVYYKIEDNQAIILSYGYTNCITIPKNIIKDNKSYKVNGTADFAFQFLNSVIVPDGVENISKSAFDDFGNTYVFFQSQTQNGWENHVNHYFSPQAYFGINNTNFIEIDGMQFLIEDSNAILCRYIGKEVNIKVPSNISINNKTFNVITIGKSAFYKCKSVEKIELNSEITKIESGAFVHCSNLKDVTLLDSILEIGDQTFINCSSLKTIELPSSINQLPYLIFENCTSLEKIIIPGNIKYISQGAFWNCMNLKEVIIEEGVIELGYNCFNNCISLDTIIIPNSVVKVHGPVFTNCNNLTVYCFKSYSLGGWDYEGVKKVYYLNEWEYDSNGNPVPLS